MNYEEARRLVIAESLEGIAYTSRSGHYPSLAEAAPLLSALGVIHESLRGQPTIDRGLAAALFSINDQVQGNMDGALSKGIPVPNEFLKRIYPELNGLLYAIFEDHES